MGTVFCGDAMGRVYRMCVCGWCVRGPGGYGCMVTCEDWRLLCVRIGRVWVQWG